VGLRAMEGGSVDLIVTDPPYNVGIDYGETTDDNKSREQFIEWMRPRFQEMRRVAKTVLICGQGRLPDLAIIEPWKWLLAWWKPAAMGRSPVGFNNFEPIAMWGKGSSAGCDWIRAEIIPDEDIGWHPCPKPLQWGRKLIALFPDAKTVLDPFAGSGTVPIAAEDLGKRWRGFEINAEYCKRANERIERWRAQGVLALDSYSTKSYFRKKDLDGFSFELKKPNKEKIT